MSNNNERYSWTIDGPECTVTYAVEIGNGHIIGVTPRVNKYYNSFFSFCLLIDDIITEFLEEEKIFVKTKKR